MIPKVRLRLFITPADDDSGTSNDASQTPTELLFTDSSVESCIVDNLELPSCAVKSNGIPVEFTINEYDNIICLYNLYNSPEYFYDITGISMEFEAQSFELSDPVLVNGITAIDESSFDTIDAVF